MEVFLDLATVVGLVGCFGLMLLTMLLAGSILMFWDLTSIIVVIGGSFFSVLVRWPLKNFIGGLKVGIKTVINNVDDPHELIDVILQLAKTAREQSILSLEKIEVENKYLGKAVRFMVDGHPVEVINGILDVESDGLEQRHKDGRAIFENLGEACPAFGMIGTVIGLVVIMANLTDPTKIGPGLAVALITTLYGSMVANMVFIPLAQKLKFRSQEELLNLSIIQEGVNCIIRGENPRTIAEKLDSFLADSGGNSEE